MSKDNTSGGGSKYRIDFSGLLKIAAFISACVVSVGGIFSGSIFLINYINDMSALFADACVARAQNDLASAQLLEANIYARYINTKLHIATLVLKENNINIPQAHYVLNHPVLSEFDLADYEAQRDELWHQLQKQNATTDELKGKIEECGDNGFQIGQPWGRQ